MLIESRPGYMPNPSETGVNHEAIKVNKERAFQGRLGQKRDAFCLAYTRKKREIILAYRTDHLGAITSAGEKISCQQGCTYCCIAYMQASVQECEAIVHYLLPARRLSGLFPGGLSCLAAKAKRQSGHFPGVRPALAGIPAARRG
jgi:hypothetical protein